MGHINPSAKQALDAPPPPPNGWSHINREWSDLIYL
jgi:hypothetical protein